jgi:methyl-accepting chemotaxis protein
MANTSIQQSLIDLEDNLKSLRSAREQVESVTDGVEELITSVRELTDTIETLSTGFDPSEFSIEDKLNEALQVFSTAINNGALKAIDEYEKLSGKNSDLQKKVEDKVNDALGVFSSAINSGAEKALDDYKGLTEKNAEALGMLSEGLQSFTANLSEVEQKIKKFDPHDSIREVNEKLMNVQDRLKALQISSESTEVRTSEILSELQGGIQHLTVTIKSLQDEMNTSTRLNRVILLVSCGIGLVGVVLAFF